MNEAETRVELIGPALKAAGWGMEEVNRVLREEELPNHPRAVARSGAAQ